MKTHQRRASEDSSLTLVVRVSWLLATWQVLALLCACMCLQRVVAPPTVVQLQLEKLTAAFQCVTEDLRRQFMVDGEPLLHEDSIGSSPVLASSFRRQIGFSAPERPPLTFSPGTCCAYLPSDLV